MHEWSRSIDSPQLLQAMAQGETAAVQQIHDKASSLVQQLEQQLQQVTEPVAVSWLKASAYDTYALLLRTKDWLSSLRDLHAAQTLADLVKVGKERTLHSAGCLAYGLNSRRAGLGSKGEGTWHDKHARLWGRALGQQDGVACGAPPACFAPV
jgi:hypothetical protein